MSPVCGEGRGRDVFLGRSLGVGGDLSMGYFPSCIIYLLLKIILWLIFFCEMGALLLFPSDSVMLFPIGKRRMWLLSFPFLRVFPYILGRGMWKSRASILWKSSRASLSSSAWLILLHLMSQSFLCFGGLRFLERWDSLLGKFFMAILAHWIGLLGSCHRWVNLFVVSEGKGRLGPYSLAL